MRNTERAWWVSATVLSLAAFSFFAGLGIRGLYQRLKGPEVADSLLSYPRIASANPQVADPNLRPLDLYLEVLRKLQLYYVDPLPSDTHLAYGSVDQMLASLNDPNTRLMSPEEADAVSGAVNGQYSGLGAVLVIKRYQNPDKSAERLVTVVSVAPGSPAEKAGLQPGDRITEIDGRWIAPLHVSYRQLTQLTEDLGPQDLRPRDPEEEPEEVKPDPEREKQRKEAAEARERWKNATDLSAAMKILASGREERELTVERGKPAQVLKVKVALAPTEVPVVVSRKLESGAGYLRIQSFGSGTVSEVTNALREFEKGGVKNLVLDLRNSPGGNLEVARDVAGMLLGEVKFALLKQRNAERQVVTEPVMARAGDLRFKPAAVSVLVDGGTAGSSELLAAALREHLNAKLVGSTTFGDGSEQELVRLENGAAISLTRAEMLTGKGVEFDGKGLKADITPQGEPVDAAVKALAQSARPATAGAGA